MHSATSLASDANISVSTGVLDAVGPTFAGTSTYGGVASSANFDGMVYYTAPAYTYAWSNGATTANVSNLGMGPIAVLLLIVMVVQVLGVDSLVLVCMDVLTH